MKKKIVSATVSAEGVICSGGKIIAILGQPPRKSRIDTLGALHHVIACGIGKRKIFNDDLDRNYFLERPEWQADFMMPLYI